MFNSPSEQLFRVCLLYLHKNGSSTKKVSFVRSVPTRRMLIFSALDNIDDDSKFLDVHISVETVPDSGDIPVEVLNINFCCLWNKL